MQFIKDNKLWLCIIVTLAIGLLSGLSTMNAEGYYQSLIQPYFAPPAWLFGPVWTVLYILMGISLYLILRHNDIKQRHQMLTLFITQFIFNVLWPVIFFTFKLMMFSVIEIIVLWGILLTLWIYSFRYLSANAILLAPYFLWTSFAVILNISVWWLN